LGTHRSAGTYASKERREAIGRIGGLLFIIGGLLSIPSALTSSPPVPGTVYVIIGAALAFGVLLLLLRWDNAPPIWFHLVVITGTVLITLGMRVTGVHGSLYSWLYMLVGIGVSFAFSKRSMIALYLLLITGAMATQLIDTPLSAREVLRNIAVSAPSLVIACAVIVYFRERLEEDQRLLRRLAKLDPLTGVGNYRALHERLAYEIARHSRHGRSFAVLLIDLDSFKQVNENYGHLEGDRVLSDVGEVLTRAVRDEDTVARQGGDEFSVLAPEAGDTEARMLAARIREALGEINVGDRQLTAVVGTSIYPLDGETPERLLARADRALLQGKHELSDSQPYSIPAIEQLRH
jgi:diguanylate cyclase (GGDEF)-like protein